MAKQWYVIRVQSGKEEKVRRGLEKRPDVWEIPFFLGFNAYFFAGDFLSQALPDDVTTFLYVQMQYTF